jgi:glycosyltransferase involved in cell wall biosynthesis
MLTSKLDHLKVTPPVTEGGALTRAADISDRQQLLQMLLDYSKIIKKCDSSPFFDVPPTTILLAINQIKILALELCDLSDQVGGCLAQTIGSLKFQIGRLGLDRVYRKIRRTFSRQFKWEFDHFSELENKKSILRLHFACVDEAFEKRQEETDLLRPYNYQFLKDFYKECFQFCESLIPHILDEIELTNNLISSAQYRSGEFIFKQIFKSSKGQNSEVREQLQKVTDQLKTIDSSIKNLNKLIDGRSRARKSGPISFTAVQFTPPVVTNPYYTMIPEALATLDVHYLFCNNFGELKTLINQNKDRPWIVCFHQLEVYYHDQNGDPTLTQQNANELLNSLAELKSLGAILVLTQHNPLPHNRCYQEIDTDLNKKIKNYFDRFIVLGNFAKRHLSQFVDEKRIEVIRHPSFKDYYGPAVLNQEIRKELSISDDKLIFGALGEIQPYKGIEQIIETARRFQESGNKKAQFLIIGRARDSNYFDSLLLQAPANTKIINQYVESEQIPAYLASFDYSVYAFRDIWASSSVVLSLSYGCPVIAPNICCLSEYVSDRNFGFLYDPDGDGLYQAVQEAIQGTLAEHIKYMTPLFNQQFALEKITKQFKDFYTDCLNQNLISQKAIHVRSSSSDI